MKIVSVNVGIPREVFWKGMKVSTGIFKRPVDGLVRIAPLNLEGDRQADLTVHGGVDKAVYAYPAEHYDYWRKELREEKLSWGSFGENLTTEGLLEDTVCVGDEMRIGTAVLIVTQPRTPCYKLALRLGRDDMVGRFLASRRTGFYFSVIEPGDVGAGSQVTVLSRDPNQVSIADVMNLYLHERTDADLMRRALSVMALPGNWKSALRNRAAS